MFYYKKQNMYIFSKDEKATAHNISVIDFLGQNYGFTFKKQGSSYRCVEHNSLVVNADEKSWYWNSHGYGGGDVVEFVRKYENLNFEEALKKVLNPIIDTANTDTKYKAAPVKIEPEKRELLLPPTKQGKYSRVYAYLTKTRCIDKDIVTVLLHKKFIYEDTKGNCVFVGYNKNGMPAYAAIRTTLTEHRFRHDAIGSDKNNGFYIMGFDKSTIYVFEAPIDLLSHATIANMQSDNNREWLNACRLSLGGVSDNALENYLSNFPGTQEICFCLDNDAAGKEATEKYMTKYADMGYKVSSHKLNCKDCNEELVNIVKKNTSRQVLVK